MSLSSSIRWGHLLGRFTSSNFTSLPARSIQTSNILNGPDSREKRLGYLAKRDDVEGEKSAYDSARESYELIDENLMEKVFDNVKFKDIPALHITCTRNNTKIALLNGKSEFLYMRSAGTEGYKNCRKGTSVAAQAVANRMLTFCQDHNIKTVRMVFNGLGPGRGAAFRVFEISEYLNVVSLSDRTEAIEPWIQRPRKQRRI